MEMATNRSTTLLLMPSRHPTTRTAKRGTCFAPVPAQRIRGRFKKRLSRWSASLCRPLSSVLAPSSGGLRSQSWPTLRSQNVLFAEAWCRCRHQRADAEVVEKFLATFAAPLSASKKEALRVLFSAEFDPVAMNLDLARFDAEDI